MSTIIDGLYYAPTHEWVKIDGEVAAIGITDHAQHELTDVVYVELPKVGKAVTAKAPSAVVESVKAASDIYSPLTGEVVAVNEKLVANPALVNTDPFGEGWIYKMKLGNSSELEGLLQASAYRTLVGS